MPRVVAAFDFDGTLSRRDTFVPFLRSACGDAALAGAIASRLHVLLAAGVGRVSRGRAKETLLQPLLGGRRLADLEPVAEAFAARVLATAMWPPGLERLEWHRRRGDEVVIVSASPELYLAPVGRELGARAVLATGLEVDGAGRITGRLAGPNVRGAEKVVRLDAWLGGDAAEVWAYGNSDGDRQLLARADRGFRRSGGGFTPAS